ncbi:1156_t:CDS:2, partial [Cetraspora pellucida]
PGPNPSKINEAIRLFSDLADLDFEPGYNNHIYFQYLSNSKDDITLLDAHHSEEIFDKYIIQVAGKRFTVVNHLSEVYELPDAHECIDGNLPLCLVLDIDARQKPDLMNPKHLSLDGYKIFCKDLLFRILIACSDIIYFDLKHLITLNAFTLANLRGFVEKVAKRVEKLYSKFINIDLYKSHFSLCLLGSAKENRVKRPAISSKPERKEKFQPIEDETALSVRTSLVTAKYG